MPVRSKNPERDAAIARRYEDDWLTYKEVAAEFGLSYERVRQIVYWERYRAWRAWRRQFIGTDYDKIRRPFDANYSARSKAAYKEEVARSLAQSPR